MPDSRFPVLGSSDHVIISIDTPRKRFFTAKRATPTYRCVCDAEFGDRSMAARHQMGEEEYAVIAHYNPIAADIDAMVTVATAGSPERWSWYNSGADE